MDISRLVSHPHVARTFETGEYHGVHYIAMEYIPGKTLYRLSFTFRLTDDGTTKVTVLGQAPDDTMREMSQWAAANAPA